METEFWLQTWRDGKIGFHRDAPMPLLVQYWPSLELAADSRVLVPLCGKSLDLLWLAEQGHRVLGVELSPLAVQRFLKEHALDAEVHESAQGIHHVAGNIEIIQGNVLNLDDATLASCQAIYDRAAVIALPADMRRRYAERVYARLAPDCKGLMITLDYPQQQMQGPPFSVDAQEVHDLLGDVWSIDLLERRDILAQQPSFLERGITQLHTGIFRLHRRSTD